MPKQMTKYVCEQCGVNFPRLSQLLHHRRTENHWQKFICPSCKKSFSRKDNLERHLKKHADENTHHCPECLKVFTRQDALDKHFSQHHDQIGGGGVKRKSQDVDNEVTKRLKQYDDPRQFYDMTKVSEKRIEKFNTKGSTYKVNFKNIEVTEDVVRTLTRIFKAIFADITKGAKAKDLVRLVVESPSLDYPIVIPFDRLPTLTPERFMSEIERVIQSNEDFVIDSGLIIEVTIVDMPEGGVGKRCRYVDTQKFLTEKRCIIRIQNDDALCCARAIITAKAKLDQHENWNSIRMGRDIQTRLAEQLHKDANVPLQRCGLEEIKLFQTVLPDYQINVVSKDHFHGIVFQGPESENKLYLYYHDEHFDVITSMAAFLSRNYFCDKCQKGYTSKESHKCNNACHACRKIHADINGSWTECEACHRFFRGQECFDLHKKSTASGNSTCSTIYRCTTCGKTVNKNLDKKHMCGQIYCNTCRDFVPQSHLCYMTPEQSALQEEPMSIEEELVDSIENAKTFIYFDFECRQDDFLECDLKYKPDVFGKCQNCLKSGCGVYEHRPNLCVAQKVCTFCMDQEADDCENCEQREHVFSGKNTLNDFCNWLFSGQNINSTVICHNFQGYDSFPILQFLYAQGILPTIIPNGAKIMSLTVPLCKIKMIDSINFLPMALAKLPSMFGLEELKKGYFPHLFNRKENQHAVLDSLPDMKYYNPDAMKSDESRQFMKWFEEHKNDSFNFQEELVSYCRSDVDILRRCCCKFRNDFIDVTGIDPFERCITIASACNLVFRTNFLKADTIGLIPPHGYKPEQKQSVKAIQWIKYLSHIRGHRIQHAKNGGEKEIGPYRVDGYYDTPNGERVVLEFHGDFWHGNPLIYSRETMNPVSNLTMGELYDKTIEKRQYLEKLGFTYIEIWESEFDKQYKEDAHMKTFVDSLDLVTPLQPRDAFFGGRTEAFTLYKEAYEGEDIDYYDVTSLYPWVNKTGKIPVGHPEIVTENFESIEKYEGLIKCKIVPPKGLFHPVLPCKTNGKLLFHLCHLCALTQNQDQCSHTDEERSFIGTWVSDEVKMAVEKGYKIVRMYEVWHFNEISRYDPETMTGGLFTEYVNTFLKIKQEASGWPDWVQTEDDKLRYIDLYEEREGIRLEYHKIRKNPGMRALAKLMLNSFWGKFGQRSNLSQVDMVSEPKDYFEKLTCDSIDVTAVNFVSEEFVEMRWKYKDAFVDTNPKTNTVIAAYTTSQARLKLYSYLEQLGSRALYADTDSVVFSTKINENKPTLGDYLGDLTDEVPHNEIVTFVTGGPKNYGYELKHPGKNGQRAYCKVRGITLNCKNTLNVNFNVLKTFVTKRQNASVYAVNAHKISRDRDSAKLLTVNEKKEYRIVFDKRVLRGNYVSYPFGY